jgi:hypothetical protein
MAAIVGGTAFSSPGLENVGFLWTPSEGRLLLSELITDSSWHITDAYSINDDGWILASGYQGTDSAHAAYSYLLLRPTPEPGVAMLLGLSAVSLAMRRRSRNGAGAANATRPTVL